MFGFFGSKKTKQEQKESEKSPVSHGVTRDDFTFLPPLPSYFNQANQSTKPEAPSATTVAETTPIGADNQTNKYSELEGVPFQLSAQCEALVKNSTVTSSNALPFVKKLDLSQFNYNFAKEKAVLKEYKE